MITVKLTTIGKLHNEFAKKWVEQYKKYISNHVKLEIKFLKEEKLNEGKNEAEVLRREGERIISVVQPGDYLVILDKGGKRFDSKYFAKFLDEYLNRSDVTLHFVIGGSIGVSRQILQFADMKLSLSDMTFPHQLAVVVSLEQLFRGISIVKGVPYHK